MDLASKWTLGITIGMWIANLICLWLVWSVKKGLVTRTEYEENREAARLEKAREEAALDDRIQIVHGRVNKTNDRLDKAEAERRVLVERIEHMPKAEDFHRLDKRMEQMHGDVRTLSATVSGLDDTMKKIEHPLNMVVQHHFDLLRDREVAEKLKGGGEKK